MYFVYLLEGRGGKRYVGFTSDLKARMKSHMSGKVYTTKTMLPVRLVYVEGCLDASDARRREGYLKKSGGKKFLAKRLKDHYSKL